VAGILRKHGVREVITVDPHTTTMLRTVYPKLVDGYDVHVRSYLEVLAERGLPVGVPLSGTVAIHDSCVYARYEGIVDEPRRLRAAAPDCVTMCPTCLVNLRKAANGTKRFLDISDHLLDAVAERGASAAHVGGPTL